ncbi:MAG: S-layer homology domain-containing protein [bacterium]
MNIKLSGYKLAGMIVMHKPLYKSIKIPDSKFKIQNSKLIIILFLLALFARSVLAQDAQPKSDEIFLRSLEDFKVEEKVSPYRDIPLDHWAYQAVKHMANLGLLEGYEGGFQGDQPLTRYELAVIVSRMIDKMREWIKTGEVRTSGSTVDAGASLKPAPTVAPPPQPAGDIVITPQKTAGTGERTITHKDITLKTKAPAMIGEPKEKEKKEKEKEDKEKKIKVPDALEKTAKKHELTEKDVDIFEALVDYVKDELKEKQKEISAEIKEIGKELKSSQKDITDLQKENERFRVTGGVSFSLSTEQEEGGNASVGDDSSISFSFYTKPRRTDDLTVTHGALTDGDPYIKYQNFLGGARNLKFRALYMGPVSAFSSLFTTGLGVSYTGINTEMLIGNDYTFVLGIGRKDVKNYLYMTSLRFNLFNETRSMAHLTRMFTFQDKSQITCTIGAWSGSAPCTPDESNSITSFFLRYPLIPGTFLTAEYAHSTYGRRGFNMMYDNTATNFDPANMFVSGTTGWRPIPNQSDQDDSFVINLDYTKGDLRIPAIGYARLGKKFVSKYMGLAGVSTEDLAGGLIPIQIQGFEVFYVAQGALAKRKENFNLEFTLVKLREIDPIYLDWSRFDTAMAFQAIDKINNRTRDGRIEAFIAQNKLTYYFSDTFSISGEFTFADGGLGPDCLDGEFVQIKDDEGNVIDAVLGDGTRDCSAANAANDLPFLLNFSSKSSEYNLYWRMASKTEYTLEFKMSELTIDAYMGEEAGAKQAVQALTNLTDQGTDYEFNQSLTYRLTDFSSVKFWYNNRFGREDFGRVKSADKESYGFSFSMSY